MYKTESDPESEEGERDEEESDFEDHDTFEKYGRYRPITKSPEDELNLHTDGEINSGEKQTNDKITENEIIRRSNCESRYGGITYTKFSGCEIKSFKCHRCYWRKMEQPKKSTQTANEACRLHPRENPNT